MSETIETGEELFWAAFGGHFAKVKDVCEAEGLDVNWRHPHTGYTPFNAACHQGHMDIVLYLLSNPGVDVNVPNVQDCTPLYAAGQNGHLRVIEAILASDRTPDIAKRATVLDPNNYANTAAEWARKMNSFPKYGEVTTEDYERNKLNGPAIADLLDDYERDPVAVKGRLFRLPHLRDPFISRSFAIVVFYSDSFLRLGNTTPPNVRRFMEISSHLPLELQMLLCNRMFGSEHDTISLKSSEPAFTWLAKQCASMPE